jgi:hypothetical protein
MTDLLLENIKLIILFLLIGSIIGLAHFGGEKAKAERAKRLHKYGRPASAPL